MIHSINDNFNFDVEDHRNDLLRIDLVLVSDIEKFDVIKLNTFIETLTAHGLGIMEVKSNSVHYLLLEGSFCTLAKQAEILKIKMPLVDKNYFPVTYKSKLFFDALDSEDNKELFTYENGSRFKNFSNKHLFFTQCQRSILLLDLLETNHFEFKENEFKSIQQLLKGGIFTDFFVLHNDVYVAPDESVYIQNHVKNLQKAWQNPFSLYPLIGIRDYLGLRIARCYNWLQYFVINLWIISILGLCTTLYGLTLKREKSLFDNCLTPIFACIIVIWCILFTSLWKFRRKKVDLSWSLQQLSEMVPNNKYNQNTYNTESSVLNILAKVILGFFAFLLNFLSVTSYALFRVICREIIFLNFKNKILFSDILSTIFGIFLVNGLQIILGKIAEKMLSYEKHDTLADRDKSLISTRFLFDLINNYACIIYLAYFRKFYRGLYFYSRQLSDSCGINQNCFHLVSLQLNLLAFFQPLKRLFTTIIIPNLKKAKSNIQSRKVPENLRELLASEQQKPPLPDLGAIHFRDKIMAFCSIALFSTASPIGPFLVLLTTFIDRLCDSRRLLNEYRRPLLNRVHSIEYWKSILDLICYLCIVNNAFLLGLTSQFGYDLKDGLLCQNVEGHASIKPTDINFWIIIIIQNAGFGFKYMLSYVMKI